MLLPDKLAFDSNAVGRNPHTIVSVTYGVGVHPLGRIGAPPFCWIVVNDLKEVLVTCRIIDGRMENIDILLLRSLKLVEPSVVENENLRPTSSSNSQKNFDIGLKLQRRTPM
jgi:hypothetical protein